jgi:hypothetical protein
MSPTISSTTARDFASAAACTVHRTTLQNTCGGDLDCRCTRAARARRARRDRRSLSLGYRHVVLIDDLVVCLRAIITHRRRRRRLFGVARILLLEGVVEDVRVLDADVAERAVALVAVRRVHAVEHLDALCQLTEERVLAVEEVDVRAQGDVEL